MTNVRVGAESEARPSLAQVLRGRAVEPTVPRSEACLNCGDPLVGPFCAACGQRDVPPYPSVRDLVVDAFWELSGWDGRFVSTVRALVQRPGMLTREFLEGRRARYLSPLRLYLLASLLYFVVAAGAPDIRLESGKQVFVGVHVSTSTGAPSSRPARVAAAAERSLGDPNLDLGALTPAEKAAVLKDVERAPAVMRPFLHRAINDPAGLKRGMVQTMPRMLFALLPVFAAILALFYRGRRYPEHLYFAIHLQAFVFLALTAGRVARFARLPVLALIVGGVAMAWIATYATLAFRRVYGGSLARTLAKELAIGVIYGAVSLAAFVCVLYWVSVYG